MADGQCAIVVKYVYDGSVHKRLLSVVGAISFTGKAPFDLIKSPLDRS